MREARAGDRYLLCSDGLSGVVSEETLAEAMLAIADPDEAADRLIELALRGAARTTSPSSSPTSSRTTRTTTISRSSTARPGTTSANARSPPVQPGRPRAAIADPPHDTADAPSPADRRRQPTATRGRPAAPRAATADHLFGSLAARRALLRRAGVHHLAQYFVGARGDDRRRLQRAATSRHRAGSGCTRRPLHDLPPPT